MYLICQFDEGGEKPDITPTQGFHSITTQNHTSVHIIPTTTSAYLSIMQSLIGFGGSSVVFGLSSTRVVKQAHRHCVAAIEHERRVLDRLNPSVYIVKHFPKATDGEIELERLDLLRDVLKREPTPAVEKREEWAIQIVQATMYIHSKNVIHGDLTPGNMLLDPKHDVVVLCDFASSSLYGERPEGAGGEARFYPMACKKVTIQNDISALGSVFYELSELSPPYGDLEEAEAIRLLRSVKFPPVHHLRLGPIITKCWEGGYETADQVFLDLQIEFGKRSSWFQVARDSLIHKVSSFGCREVVVVVAAVWIAIWARLRR